MLDELVRTPCISEGAYWGTVLEYILEGRLDVVLAGVDLERFVKIVIRGALVLGPHPAGDGE